MDFYRGFETLLLLGAVQGFMLAIILPKSAKVARQARVFLSLLLLAVSSSLVLYLQIVVYGNWPGRMLAFLDTAAFLFAPLIYLYIKTLFFGNIRLSGQLFLHFLPAGLHCFYGIFLFRYTEIEMLLLLERGAFHGEWMFIFSLLVCLTLIYWALCVKLVSDFKRKRKEISGKTLNIRYISLFLIALLLGDLISILFALDYFFGLSLFAIPQIYVGWIIIPFLVYALTYVAIDRPEIMRVVYPKSKNRVARLSGKKMEDYGELLKHAMEVEKLYLDPELDLIKLADALRLHPTKLSYLINTNYSCNFYDFVNRYRITDFVEKLKDDKHKHHTLLALALDVGFNSKTTFNKYFKAEFQITPRQYVKNLI